MRSLQYFFLILSLTIWSYPGKAQFMSKKEILAIDELLNELSEQHQPKTYLFKDVNLLTMLDSTIVEGQDVLIENGLIKKIGTAIDHEQAMIIDGQQKYLIPGLTDMHVHLFDQHQMKNTWILLLLLNGVTTVRDMAGEPNKLMLRDKINNNELLAPNIYQAGPIINGFTYLPVSVAASTPENGRELVRSQKKVGYDFIKVYDDLNIETYWAILDEAQQLHLQVVGHLPKKIKLKEALNKQTSIEHLRGYFGWKNNVNAFLTAEENYATNTANSATWNCPTLYHLLLNWDKEMTESVLSNEKITKVLPNKLLKRWETMIAKNKAAKEELLNKYGSKNKALFNEIVRNLYLAKAKLISGTDAGNIPFLVPGFSLHEELIAFTNLGISTYDALKMATIYTASAMDKEKIFGSIVIGNRADLLQLDENPLENIQSLSQEKGVMIRGIWLSKNELAYLRTEMQNIFGND